MLPESATLWWEQLLQSSEACFTVTCSMVKLHWTNGLWSSHPGKPHAGLLASQNSFQMVVFGHIVLLSLTFPDMAHKFPRMLPNRCTAPRPQDLSPLSRERTRRRSTPSYLDQTPGFYGHGWSECLKTTWNLKPCQPNHALHIHLTCSLYLFVFSSEPRHAGTSALNN